MKNGDKVNVYAADNRWYECVYIGKSINNGHHIIAYDGRWFECAKEMIKPIDD